MPFRSVASQLLRGLSEANREAERQYRRSLELRDEHDQLGRGRSLIQLGFVARQRFRQAWTAGRNEEALQHINEAVRACYEALDLFPEDAIDDQAMAHQQLGSIYGDAEDLDSAVQHYRRAVQLHEQAGNLYSAAETRGSMAIDLFNAGRQADALEYAEAALRGFESYGERAGEMIERTRGLIAEIRGASAASPARD